MLKMVIIWFAIALFHGVVADQHLPGIRGRHPLQECRRHRRRRDATHRYCISIRPRVVSTIGGSGEGLNCSLPALVQHRSSTAARTRTDKHHLVLQRFRQACVFHDLCYRHGLATYGYNQNDCDRILQNEAFRLCLYIRNGTAESQRGQRCQTDSKLVLGGREPRRLRRLSRLEPVNLFRVRIRPFALERVFCQPGG